MRDFADGRLSPEARLQLQAHLAGCEGCRQLLAAAEAAAGDLGTEDTLPPRPLLAPGMAPGDERLDGTEDTLPPRSAYEASGVGSRQAPAPTGSSRATQDDVAGGTLISSSRAAPPASTEGELVAGAQVGRFRFERTLGTGGMGRVLLAHDPELDRRVALKVLRAQDSADRGLEARLLREAQAMARVSHPNVVAVHDVGTWNGQVFIAMEYVEGETLSAWLREKRSVRQVLEVLRKAGAGLAAAHRVGLVHRDFKPDNVLLGADGGVRVTDFGLARAASSGPAAEPPPAPVSGSPSVLLDRSLTMTGAVLGTPGYMSPEQHEGKPTDARTDQFSFCVVLYQALYGEPPFPGKTLTELRRVVTAGQIRTPPRDARVPDWLRDAVLRGLSLDPAARFPSMDALLEVLARDPEVDDGLERPDRQARRARAGGALLGAVATLLVAALASTQAWLGFEERVQGLLLAARPRPWNPDIVMVELDEATLREQTWPTPRHLQARVLEALARAGAKAVGYDMFFIQPGRDGPEADAHFARALAGYGKAVVAVPCAESPEPQPERLAATLAGSTVPRVAWAPEYPGMVLPVAPLLGSARLAQVRLAQSASGNARGAYPLISVAGRSLPSLSLAMFLAGESLPLSALEPRADALRVGGLEVPVDRAGAALASFRVPTTALSFGPLSNLVSKADPPTFPEDVARELRGRYVLLGQTAGSIRDVGPFANGLQLPLVYLHGALLADLLEHRPVREAPPWARLLLVLGLGALLTAAALVLRPLVAAGGLLVVLFGLAGGSLLLAEQGLVLAPLGPAAAAVLSFALVFAGRVAANERGRRAIRTAFHAYVSPGALDRILLAPRAALPLEGARRRVSVLCASVDGAIAPAERRSPEEEVARLRGWLKLMVERVLAHDGRVEVLRADGLMAVFGDPLPRADHARRALEAALEIRQALAGAEPEAGLRLGVATGPVLVGNVGPDEGRIEYAVHGEPVREAARLAREASPGELRVSAEARWDCEEGFAFERVESPESPATSYRALARS